MDKVQKETNDLRLGSYCTERWAKELDASEWIIRQIILALDDGNGVEIKEIRRNLQDYIVKVIATQNGGPRFYFSLGGNVTLQDWLEDESETDRLGVNWDGDLARYSLSDYIERLLDYRRDEIEELIIKVTGHKIEVK